MNRRSFFRTLAAATAGFTILPPATTYDRVWKATYRINPEWAKATYVMQGGVFSPIEYAGEWRFVPWLDVVEKGEFPRGVALTTASLPIPLDNCAKVT